MKYYAESYDFKVSDQCGLCGEFVERQATECPKLWGIEMCSPLGKSFRNCLCPECAGAIVRTIYERKALGNSEAKADG